MIVFMLLLWISFIFVSAVALLMVMVPTTIDKDHFEDVTRNAAVIKEEAVSIDTYNDKVRPAEMWDQDIKQIVDHYGDNTSWSIAWDSKLDWYEYPLVIEKTFVGKAQQTCPQTSRLLAPYLDQIGVAAFSKLTKGKSITKHKDYETRYPYNYHLGLTGDATLQYFLGDDDEENQMMVEEPQTFGRNFIFEPGKYFHQVKNNSDEDRIVLVIIFQKTPR